MRGVSLREIADSTKISVRFLAALENDRLDVLPGGIFRRAFVREYARHLGLDAERLVADFVFVHGSDAATSEAPVKESAAPARGTLVVAALVLVLIPLLVGKAWRERRSPPPVASNAPAALVERVYSTPAAPQREEPASNRDDLALTLSAKDEC